jgi:hypothetical protein
MATHRIHTVCILGKCLVPLGKKKRKVIPVCVIAKIREEYGEEDDSYVGFQSAEGEDPD